MDGPTLTPRSLETEGFVHCCFEEQLEGVIERYFADEPRLVVLKLDPKRLTAKVVSEPSTGGENFPHLYGPIDLNAMVEATVRMNPNPQ
jgi:uncharacterized protein (DUF952 family)